MFAGDQSAQARSQPAQRDRAAHILDRIVEDLAEAATALRA
jgi:hypothetical protein